MKSNPKKHLNYLHKSKKNQEKAIFTYKTKIP